MTKYIAILRGINVGGNRKILMADLKNLLSQKGFKNVVTYIQSGNITFNHCSESSSAIETIIIKAIKEYYDFDVPTIVMRTGAVQKIIENNPFTEDDASKLHVTFFNEQPDLDLISKIKDLNFAPDKFQFTKKAVYLCIADKYHKTKLSNAYFEKKLKVTATTRNWKTVNKLLQI